MSRKILVFFLVAMLVMTTVAGCAGGSDEPADSEEVEETQEAQGETYKVGILAPAVTHGWVAAVAYNAELEAQELGVDYQVQTSTNAEEMTAQLEDLVTWGAQAVVAFPQWEGMEIPIQEAIDEGITVVNFDIQIDADGIYLVTGDNYDMGVQGAHYILDKIGPEGVVVALPVPQSGSVSELRMAGFTETAEELDQNWEILEYATAFTREDGLADFADILAANPQIDAVYSLDDETSIGVIQAITEAGRTDIKVITGGGGNQEYFNMMPEYEDMYVQSALYSPAMVREAVKMAVDILAGKDVESPMVIPTSIVDKDNYTDYLDADSPY